MDRKPARAGVIIGMVEASLKGKGPGGEDEELLEKLRDLVREGREHHREGNFSPAMARMRVAHDKIALHLIHLSNE